MNPPTRALAWRWIANGLAPLYLAVTLAAAASKVWPADVPPFFQRQFHFLAAWLPGVDIWPHVIDLRGTFLDGRFQHFMPLLIALLGCWIHTVYRASGIFEQLAEQRRRDHDRSMREEMRQRIPSK